jgi:hypothetical protein
MGANAQVRSRLVDPSNHRLVFVAGLHRSGTTPLAKVLAGHPQVSGFSGTPAREDEGQHLQSVYPPARVYGGAGRFARKPAAHLTETSPLVSDDSRERLLQAWRPHWDLSKPVLVEKSPPNLVMTRFLQALYPEASMVVVIRHPVVVSLSTKKWTRGTSLHNLMRHWFRAHELFRADAPSLSRLHVLRYEDLVDNPEETLAGVAEFLGLDGPIPAGGIQGHRSSSYEKTWSAMSDGPPWSRFARRRIEKEFASAAEQWGYRLDDLHATAALPDFSAQVL